MAKYSMNGAQRSNGNFNRDKPNPGKYVAVVKNVREYETRESGCGFFLDWTIKSVLEEKSGHVPSTPGLEFAFSVFPDTARGGNGLSLKDAKARDLGKIQAAVAAAFGFPESEADYVDDEVYEKSLADGDKPSPLAGREIIVDVVPHTNQRGQPSSFQRVYPYLSGGEPVTKAAAKPAAAPAKPPAAPKAKPAFPPKDWKEHNEAPGYFYWEGDGEPEHLTSGKCYEAADVKAAYGL